MKFFSTKKHPQGPIFIPKLLGILVVLCLFSKHTTAQRVNASKSNRAGVVRKNVSRVSSSFSTRKPSRISPRSSLNITRRKSDSRIYTNRSQSHRAPSDNRSSRKWDVGWYAKWNRKRIERVSNKREKAWKGDISGRQLRTKGRPTDTKTPNNKTIASQKSRVKIGSGPLNNNRYGTTIKKLKKNAKKISGFVSNRRIAKFQRKSYSKKPGFQRNPRSNENAPAAKAPGKIAERANQFAGNIKVMRLKRNPNSSRNSMIARAPTRSSKKLGVFSGHIRIPSQKRNAAGTLVGSINVSPNRAAERFSGSTRVRKFTDPRLHPDAQFAHGFLDNQDGKKTFMTNLKLLWAKIFNKKKLIPPYLKKKLKKPRYDNGEKKLWYR